MCKITKLFEIMGQRGIKAKELSEAIGASTGNISDWKSGRSSPSIEVLPKIAEFFNVSTDYLLGLDDKPNKKENSSPLSKNEKECLTKFKMLTETEQGKILDRMDVFIEEREAKRKGA